MLHNALFLKSVLKNKICLWFLLVDKKWCMCIFISMSVTQDFCSHLSCHSGLLWNVLGYWSLSNKAAVTKVGCAWIVNSLAGFPIHCDVGVFHALQCWSFQILVETGFGDQSQKMVSQYPSMSMYSYFYVFINLIPLVSRNCFPL